LSIEGFGDLRQSVAVELHQLRYFIAVTKTGSFTLAAKECSVSQPSLSIQLAKLESELGGPLIERSRRKISLTALGEAFLPHAEAALKELQLGKEEIAELSGLVKGRVRLGCLPTTGAYLLPRILAQFSSKHPQIQVSLREESSPALGQCLEKGEVDLAIMDEAGLLSALEREKLFSEDLLIAIPPSHRLARKRTLSLKELRDEPFILMKHGHGFRKITTAAFEAAGIVPRVVFESSEIDTVQALVTAGLGLSLVPRMVRKERGPAYASLTEPRAERSLYLAYRKQPALSAAAQAMHKTILSAFPRSKLP
jgi:LysR family hydrogen peroxide-inducible transcriptional activator